MIKYYSIFPILKHLTSCILVLETKYFPKQTLNFWLAKRECPGYFCLPPGPVKHPRDVEGVEDIIKDIMLEEEEELLLPDSLDMILDCSPQPSRRGSFQLSHGDEWWQIWGGTGPASAGGPVPAGIGKTTRHGLALRAGRQGGSKEFLTPGRKNVRNKYKRCPRTQQLFHRMGFVGNDGPELHIIILIP